MHTPFASNKPVQTQSMWRFSTPNALLVHNPMIYVCTAKYDKYTLSTQWHGGWQQDNREMSKMRHYQHRAIELLRPRRFLVPKVRQSS